ncbi:hypothetical protein TrVFT333_007543 [Trichoderma virens FT-333]|nr:hypothetical protein TrVFT333_007543 [Trichoderma virens FT-333]
MKFLATVTVIATAALAAPNPEPECNQIGQPCWKVKRATEVFSSAVRSIGTVETEHQGIPNEVALSALQGLDQLSSLLLYASEDPSAFLQNVTDTSTDKRDVEIQEEKRWCYRVGMTCGWKNKRDEEIQEEKRDVEVEEEKRDAEVQEEKRWCYRVGMTCGWKNKRYEDLEEEKQWCYRAGEPCWKAKPTDEIQEDKRWCYKPGQPCWKAKHVAKGVLSATIEGDEKRSVEISEKSWCYQTGQPCWKAKRNLEAIQNGARSVIEGMY